MAAARSNPGTEVWSVRSASTSIYFRGRAASDAALISRRRRCADFALLRKEITAAAILHLGAVPSEWNTKVLPTMVRSNMQEWKIWQ